MKYLRQLYVACLIILLTVLPTTPGWALSSEQEAEPEKGPHGGRILRDGAFALELSIFETGVPPEFRVWVSDDGEPIPPKEVSLAITLTRLGNVTDRINFIAQEDFLRGDMEIYEPHSFTISVKVEYQQYSYHWQYDNFEGRTAIAEDIAGAMGIKTGVASAQTLVERLPATGYLIAPKAARRDISARFEGVITRVHVAEGDDVVAGDALFTVEGNESLKRYAVKAPVNGQLVSLNAAEGELTAGKILARIVDTQSQLVELLVFPKDASRVAKGQDVELEAIAADARFTGRVESIQRELTAAQASRVRIALDAPLALPVGTQVRGKIAVGVSPVELAVKRSGLQSFRDFTVVYAKVGSQYEVRMLELGREAGEWVEVLGGLQAGTEYVTENSYLIKADIEKSGASHDH